MKVAAVILSILGATTAFVPAPDVASKVSLNMETAPTEPTDNKAMDDLSALAKELNPLVNFWDPLNLAEADFWDQGNEATIGFLRHAEHKHGRVAMMAFAGYCVQSNWHWPWKMTLEGDDFPSIDLGPEAQWDAIPEAAKWQILLVIGFFELWGEWPNADYVHYMRGGKPGVFPSFDSFSSMVHPVPFNLYDPFGLNKKKSDEKKARGLAIEINNGRLAMLGIFGFLSADAVPGSVPLLKDIAIPYDGSVMAPFAANFHVFGN